MQSLLSGLVAYWPLHEPSGSRLSVVGDNSLLTLSDNNTVTGADGKVDNASQFTAANLEYLSVADNAIVSTGDIDFFFSIWVYFDSKIDGGSFFGKDDGASSREYVLRYTGGATDRFQVFLTNDGTSISTYNFSTGGSPALSTWYNLMWWHDSVLNTVNRRVNMGGIDSTARTTGVFDGTANFELSRYAAAAGTYHNGRMCELGMWKRIPTEQEQAWIYNNGLGRAYPFDGRPAPILTSRRGHGVMARRNRLTGLTV